MARQSPASPPDRRAPNASVSSRINWIVRVAFAVALCAIATACARPIGDFGRARPGVVDEEFKPSSGRHRTQHAKQPVSSFNLSDQERDMHNRVWRFLVAPHAEGWFTDTALELQQTRVARPGSETKYKPERYYKWLHETAYASSRVRYNTVGDDAQSDINTAPQTFMSICRVIEVDYQRGVASRELNGLSYGDVAARRAENDVFIAWFTRALRYRYEAYDYALDHLLVETPHEEAIEADAKLGELSIWVERAERGDFCFEAGGSLHGDENRVPSRVLMPAPSEGIYKK